MLMLCDRWGFGTRRSRYFRRSQYFPGRPARRAGTGYVPYGCLPSGLGNVLTEAVRRMGRGRYAVGTFKEDQ